MVRGRRRAPNAPAATFRHRVRLLALAAALGLPALLVAPAAAQDTALPPEPAVTEAPPPDVTQQIEAETAELDRVRTALEQARESAKSIAARETKVLQQLNALDSDLGLKERLLAGLSRKERRLEADLERTRQRLADEQRRLEERRIVLQRRLRNIYKFGEHPGLQVLLGASSAVDLVRRFDWLLLVAAQDRLLAEQINESVDVVTRIEADLVEKQAEVREIRVESEQERAELVRRKDERGTLLQSIRTERKKHDGVVRELEQAEKDLHQLLAELQERARRGQVSGGALPPEGTGFAQRKGHLPWPVEGKVTRWFGVQQDKRFGTRTFNGGVDIEAEARADVMAVHRGRVDYVNWLPGYGQCIILNHGSGYFTLYAHTSSVLVTVGDSVEQGDVIATVGDTGSLLGDVLHFEIRKDAEPINPAPWMRSTTLQKK
jgi:septal ring factor EnvC (AmiA/AmiB activator)